MYDRYSMWFTVVMKEKKQALQFGIAYAPDVTVEWAELKVFITVAKLQITRWFYFLLNTLRVKTS